MDGLRLSRLGFGGGGVEARGDGVVAGLDVRVRVGVGVAAVGLAAVSVPGEAIQSKENIVNLCINGVDAPVSHVAQGPRGFEERVLARGVPVRRLARLEAALGIAIYLGTGIETG